MGYIVITPRKKGLPVVSWNVSRRVDGKRHPVRETRYLGLLDAGGASLVKGAGVGELPADILAGLEARGLKVSSEPAAPRGRRAMFLRRVPLDELSSARIVNVGTYRVLRGLAESCGFLRSLRSAFEGDSEAMFALMCQRLDSRMQGYLFRDWAEDTPFDELVRLSMSPKAVSALLGRIEGRRLAFAREWYAACGRPRELIEDSTHFCTCAQAGGGRECEEYSWDHHQEAGRRQINVMSLVAMGSRLPIMYRAYPGSINDISTFTETSEEMKVVDGEASILYVSDCGYFSALNMLLMAREGHGFVMEAKWDAQTLAVLKASRAALQGPGDYVRHGSYTYRCEPCTYALHDKRRGGGRRDIFGFIYYSGLEAEQLRNGLLTTALLWKKAFARYDFDDDAQAREWLDTCTGGYGRFLKLDGIHPRLDVKVDSGRIESESERFGFHVILTTQQDMSASELLETCHGRDPVEKLWRTMKSGLGARTLMTKLDATTQGQIFIVWGAAVLHRLLSRAIEDAALPMTVNEVLLTVRKIRMTCMKERKIAHTMPRKAKDVVVGFGLEREFPEYAGQMEQLVADRERRRNQQDGKKNRGRPPKFRLKGGVQPAPKEAKQEKKEQKHLEASAKPRGRGRPPKK